MRSLGSLIALFGSVVAPLTAQTQDPVVCATRDAQPRTEPLTGAARWADSARREIYVANVTSDIPRLRAAHVLLERARTAYPDDALLTYYEGLAWYRMATIQMGMSGGDVDDELDKAQAALEKSAEISPSAETSALLSAVLGQKIGSSPIRGMILGPRSGRYMDDAKQQAPNNPRVWLVSGIGAIFTPGLFGGGVDKAEQELEKAIELFRTDAPPPPLPAWGCDEAWIWLGQVYQRTNREALARDAYQKALHLEPRNAWVSQVLLPGVEGGR